jgi:hypothetical protein
MVVDPEITVVALGALLLMAFVFVVARMSARLSAVERDVTRMEGTWRGIVAEETSISGIRDTERGLHRMNDPFATLGQLPEPLRTQSGGWRLVLVADPECTACAAMLRTYATKRAGEPSLMGYELAIASNDCELPPAWRESFRGVPLVCGEGLGALGRLVPPAALVVDPVGEVRGAAEVSGYDELVAFVRDGQERGIGPEGATFGARRP